jgi:hypothetical protein
MLAMWSGCPMEEPSPDTTDLEPGKIPTSGDAVS